MYFQCDKMWADDEWVYCKKKRTYFEREIFLNEDEKKNLKKEL